MDSVSDKAVSADIIVGIDLGTTFSSVAVWDPTSKRACVIEHYATYDTQIPSWVAYTSDFVLVGQAAKDQAPKNAKNTIFDVKRIIGLPCKNLDFIAEVSKEIWPFKIVDVDGLPMYEVLHLKAVKRYSPEEVAAHILRELKEVAEKHLGTRVKKAVITVPANFLQSQKEATIAAAEIAGLEVMQLIPEPTAAALYFGFHNSEQKKEENIFVFDLGGGTFDVSVVQRKRGDDFQVITVKGNPHMGGNDIDDLLVQHFLGEFKSRCKVGRFCQSVCFFLLRTYSSFNRRCRTLQTMIW